MEQLLSMLREEFRKVVREEIQNAIKELPSNQDVWMDAKGLCKYLGVSMSWVTHRKNELPHSENPVRYQKSEIDKWMKLREKNKVTESVTPIRTSVKKGKDYKVI